MQSNIQLIGYQASVQQSSSFEISMEVDYSSSNLISSAGVQGIQIAIFFLFPLLSSRYVNREIEKSFKPLTHLCLF